MVSQTRHPCSASCDLITVASDEAAFSAEERGPSRLMEEALTNLCLSWTRPGVHHSHWLPSARPNTVLCWRKGRGARVGHGDSLCYRVKEPLHLFLFPSHTSFSPEDPRNVFLISIPQPPSSFFVLGVIWLTEPNGLCVIWLYGLCVSPDHCPKRGLVTSLLTRIVLTYEARPDAPLR